MSFINEKERRLILWYDAQNIIDLIDVSDTLDQNIKRQGMDETFSGSVLAVPASAYSSPVRVQVRVFLSQLRRR